MDLRKIGNQIDVILEIYGHLMKLDEPISALDKDFFLHSIRQLYALCILEEKPAAIVPAPVETPKVEEPAPEIPKTPEKKTAIVFTHLEEDVTPIEKSVSKEEPKTLIIETPKVEEPKTLIIETPKVEEPKTLIIETPKVEEPKTVIIETPKVEEPKTVIIETPKVEEPKTVIIETPKVEEPKTVIIETPKVEEPKTVIIETPKVEEPKTVIIETPKVEEPKTVIIETPKVEEPRIMAIELPKEEEKYAPNPDYDELFTFQVATDLSQKLGEKPIADLDKAISVGDKFLYMNQLFSGDAAAFKACRDELQKRASLDDAREYLERNCIDRFQWMDKNRKSSAREFVKLVRRLYLK